MEISSTCATSSSAPGQRQGSLGEGTNLSARPYQQAADWREDNADGEEEGEDGLGGEDGSAGSQRQRRSGLRQRAGATYCQALRRCWRKAVSARAVSHGVRAAGMAWLSYWRVSCSSSSSWCLRHRCRCCSASRCAAFRSATWCARGLLSRQEHPMGADSRSLGGKVFVETVMERRGRGWQSVAILGVLGAPDASASAPPDPRPPIVAAAVAPRRANNHSRQLPAPMLPPNNSHHRIVSVPLSEAREHDNHRRQDLVSIFVSGPPGQERPTWQFSDNNSISTSSSLSAQLTKLNYASYLPECVVCFSLELLTNIFTNVRRCVLERSKFKNNSKATSKILPFSICTTFIHIHNQNKLTPLSMPHVFLKSRKCTCAYCSL